MSSQRGLSAHLARFGFSAALLALAVFLAALLNGGTAQAQGVVYPAIQTPFGKPLIGTTQPSVARRFSIRKSGTCRMSGARVPPIRRSTATISRLVGRVISM